MRSQFVSFLALVVLFAGPVLAKPSTILDYRKEINLSDQQVQLLDRLLLEFKREMMSLQGTLVGQEQTYKKQISAQADLTTLRNTLESIEKTRVSLRMLDLATARELESILQPQQVASWKKIQDEIAQKRK